MKLCVMLVLFTLFQVRAEVAAQAVNIKVKNASLRDVFKLLKKQTGYDFLYTSSDLKNAKPVTLDLRNESIRHALEACFKEQALLYELKNTTILIRKKPEESKSWKDLQSDIQIKQREIIGKVTNEEGKSLEGVTVTIKGTPNVTTTQADGSFRITAPQNRNVLVFTIVGFESQEINTSGSSSINVTMRAAVANLDEVVLVGYGTQKKGNLTGAIEVIDSKKLANRPIGNVSQALQGLSPGLNIFTNNSGGQPDATMNFNIRGMGSPLVLVDGLPVDINLLNPQDIESISVIKDASAAAIYGANAPYGVILITTKQGKITEGKPKLSYQNNLTMGAPTRLPDPVNSLDFATAVNAATTNAGSSPLFSEEVISRIKQFISDPTSIPAVGVDPLDPTKWAKRENANGNTNWYKELLKPWAFRQKHDLSLTGGNPHYNYYVSLGLFDHRGQMRYGNEGYKRYNVDAKVSTKVTDWMKLNFLTKFSNSHIDYPNDGYGLDRSVMWHDFPRRFPTDPVKYPNGTWSEMSRFQVFEEGGREKHGISDFWTKIEAEIEPLSGWLIKGDYGWNNKNTISSLHRAKIDAVGPQGNLYTHFDTTPLNSITKTYANNSYWNANLYSSYEKSISDHSFKILIGHQREAGKFDDLSGYRDNLLTDQVPAILVSTGAIRLFDHMNEWAAMGTFARLNYDYGGKYLIEFNGRYQGSSRFEQKTRFGFFPSFSLGYRISNEQFWKPIKGTINDLKIRASYGSLGNHNVSSFLYLPVMPIRSQVSWLAGNDPMIGISAPGIISSSLTWETVSTSNIGVDAFFLNNQLSLSFDLFKREIKDMIGTPNPLPALLGTTVPQENNAAQKNTGWELSLSYKGQIKDDFRYQVSVGLSDYRTTITKWNNPNQVLSQHYEGKVLGEIWGYQSNGLFKSAEEIAASPNQSRFYGVWNAGDVKYEDLDGNKEIGPGLNTLKDHGDLSIIGNSEPRYLYNFTIGANYKNFDFNMFWNGVGKRNLAFYAGDNYFWGHVDHVWAINIFKEHMDYYKDDNTQAFWPKPYLSSETSKNRQASTRYLQNAAYLRLKNLSIGYTIPQKITNKLSVKNVRVFLNGENLLLFSGIQDFLDPEATGGNFGPGKVYPLQKTLSFGLNVNF